MNKKKLRKIVSLAIGVTIATSTINTATHAIPYGTEVDTEALIKSIQKNGNIKPSNSSNLAKVDKNIDLTSNELVNVIVEFVTDAKAAVNNDNAKTLSLTEEKVDRDHEIFENFLAGMPSTFSSVIPTIKHSYKEVFNGQSLTIKASDINKLLECEVVKKVYKDAEVKVEAPVQEKSRVFSEENSVQPFMLDSVPYLSVDKLHEENIKGEGIKVGVLDTGIDYNHPDLTGIYKGFRAEDGDPTTQDMDSVLGWDFVANDADPMETTYSDWQESGAPETDSVGNTYYTSHGTHVSGTIAGQGDSESDYAVLGVAPEVELYAYKVLGDYGGGSISAIIAGVEKSVTDGMDVINLSLGMGSINDPFDPIVTAVNNATLAGVVTVIANGNSGPSASTVGSPGTAQLPIAVGASSVDFTVDKYEIKLDTLDGEVSLLSDSMAKSLSESMTGLEGEALEFVYCGLGSVEEIAEQDVEGKIAVIDRGDLAFVEKIANATDAGAKLIVMVNNVEGTMPYLGEVVGVNTIGVSQADGEILKANLESELTINFDSKLTIEGDQLAEFSSVGPVKKTFEIRPDIVAPGSQVLSTVPEYINDKNTEEDNYGIAYARYSGTSMAAPHVAGVAALILQANPEYTPEDVKAALMNTSEIIDKVDGSSYSVHEIGAGRINPYEAVYEDIKIKAEYEVISGENFQTYNNITGMLSYGKVLRSDENAKDVEKTIPVTIENTSNENKSYDITVEYLITDRSSNCQDNNIVVEVVDTIEVAANSTNTFDTTLKVPASAACGQYEGYVHLTEKTTGDTYQLPFGTTLIKSGFGDIYYPAEADGSGEGLTGFNSSVVGDRIPQLSFIASDINVALSVNEEIEYIHAFVKDTETGEYIGHAGTEKGEWIPEGETVLIQNLVHNGKINKIINGEVSHVKELIKEGIYDLEVVAETVDGKTFKESIPMCIINDADELGYHTTTFQEGVTEVTEDMYTEETWIDGQTHEGLWIKGNIQSKYIQELKEKHGMDYLKEENLKIMFPEGVYANGMPTFMGAMFEPNGDFKIAGIERSDIEDGFFRSEIYYASSSRAMGVPKSYIFIKEGEQYLDVDFHTEKYDEETGLNATIKMNNPNDIVEGKFTLEHRGDSVLNIESIEPSEELKALLEANGNDIEIEWSVIEELDYDTMEILFKVVGDGKEVVGLNEDVELFDIKLNVDEFRGFNEELMIGKQFMYSTFDGLNGEFKNSTGEIEEVAVGTLHRNLEIDHKNRTLVYGTINMPERNMEDVNLYALDEAGNKYKPDYARLDYSTKSSYLYTFNNLPVIEGDYKIVAEVDGAFDNITYVNGSKLSNEGEMIGATHLLINDNHALRYSSLIYSGDVNEDGVIDVVDLYEIAKEYHAVIPEVETVCQDGYIRDLTQDGGVNKKDIDLILANYRMKDLTRTDVKEPQDIINGEDAIDILERIGYFEENPEYNVTLIKDKEATLVGEELTLEAVPPVEEVEFEYEFSVKDKGSDNWTVIKEKGKERTTTWVAEKSGEYEFKLRIFKDDIAYKAQDNLDHIVTVTEIANIQLDVNNLEIEIGDKYGLNVNISPENADPENFVWSSSDEDVLIVSENGVVIGIKEGEATVTVKTEDGRLEDTCKVVVKKSEDTEKPEIENPDPEKPEPGKPEPGKPEPGKPEPGKPEPGKPEPGKPETGKPDGDDKLPTTGAVVGSAGILGLAGLVTLLGVKLRKRK